MPGPVKENLALRDTYLLTSFWCASSSCIASEYCLHSSTGDSGECLTTPECSARVLSHLSVETAMRRNPRVVCCWDA